MLRVVFMAEDLARVRLRPRPDPLWEITNSFQMLRSRHGTTVFGEWRQTVRTGLSRTSRLLAPLLPPVGYSPDFLTPDLGDGDVDIDAAVDTVLRTPSARLRGDLVRLAGQQRSLDWAVELGGGGHRAVGRLGSALRAFHAEALAPYWQRVQAHVVADQAVRLRSLSEGGVEGMLANLTTAARWRPPFLEIDYPVHRTLRLGGRGIVLQPSFFCWQRPVMVSDATLPPVLVYPIERTDWWTGSSRPQLSNRQAPLGALIGNTRAAVLDAAGSGTTTSELSCRLGVSRAAISQHVGVLREAGLLITVRNAGKVLHVATQEGRALVRTARR